MDRGWNGEVERVDEGGLVRWKEGGLRVEWGYGLRMFIKETWKCKIKIGSGSGEAG